MSDITKRTKFAIQMTLVFVCLSSIANVASIGFGLAWGDSGYLRKMNWCWNPLFFILVGLLVHMSWTLFMNAWHSIHKHSLLYVGNNIELTNSKILPLLLRIEYSRKYLVIISIALGLIITALDAGCLWSEYGVFGSIQCVERDFSVAYSMSSFPDADKFTNGLFNIFAYLLQGFLIAGGFLALFQMTLHATFFLKFENIKEAQDRSLILRLNIKDPLHEYGITEFNRALNVTYIFIALAMVIPIISAASQQSTTFDFGQWLLRVLLPLLLLLPLIISYLDRVLRSQEATDRVISSSNKEDEDSLAKQKLWPFEGSRIGYLGKMAATIVIGEYAYLFNQNFIPIINSFK